jgi:hypothetical protein
MLTTGGGCAYSGRGEDGGPDDVKDQAQDKVRFFVVGLESSCDWKEYLVTSTHISSKKCRVDKTAAVRPSLEWKRRDLRNWLTHAVSHSNRIESCDMILFGNNIRKNWTLLQALPNECQWRLFDGYEIDEDRRKWRKSGSPASSDSPGEAVAQVRLLSGILEHRAARPSSGHDGYAKFRGASKWPVHTVYTDQISVQTDEWTSGHNVLLLADMLLLGKNVDDVKRLGIPGGKLQIFPQLSDFVLGRTKDAAVTRP